ncbi:MAG TPA: hypothetical protein VKB42_15530 [Dongiaceae bacterium]|nr:hypothetical protein [Dongiaceae bacterium]
MGISRKEHDAAGEDTAASWTPGENARLLRAARLVIDVYGGDAASYAVTRAALLQNMGDVMGATAWLRVAPFIEELQSNGKVESPNGGFFSSERAASRRSIVKSS